MFERFTIEARTAVITAQEHARELGSTRIRPTHLLSAVAAGAATPAAAVLDRHGLGEEAIRSRCGELDPDALRAIGVDLEAVRASADAAFGHGALERGRVPVRTGHLPFTREAKGALRAALREAERLGHRHITDGHIALGVLRGGDATVERVLTAAGAEPAALLEDLRTALGG